MSRTRIALAVSAAALFLLAVAAGYRALQKEVARPLPAAPAPSVNPTASAAEEASAESYRGFLYGRIRTLDGATYEGRLRFGGSEEAFWSDPFNGFKKENPWVVHVPPERLSKESSPITIFGVTIARKEKPFNVGRPFMARLGDIARIEAQGKEVRVTLKSGTVFDLGRFEASDFDDGVRVWDGRRGVVDLDSLRIHTIELLPTAPLGDLPRRLHGSVRTAQGEFTGFVQWNRRAGVGSDELTGVSSEGRLALRFDSLRSIARRSPASSLVTQLDGREIVLSGTQDAGDDNRGLYVDDRRYGRVLIPWDLFERVDFSASGAPDGPSDSGPAYGEFPPGAPLTGSVTTRDGRRLDGRLVYDLDESETTETLDGGSLGVNYYLPFARIASIRPLEVDAGDDGGNADKSRAGGTDGDDPVQGVLVVLHGGEELRLEGSADVDHRNGGLLVFPRGEQKPEYVRWSEVQRIDFDRPPAI